MASSTRTARSAAATSTSADSPAGRFARSVSEDHMTRVARGSKPPHGIAQAGREWLAGAVRARFPKLAIALGDKAFDAMLCEYLLHEPPARRSVRESGARL